MSAYGSVSARGSFEKSVGIGRQLAAHLEDVRAVVEPHADHRARRQHRAQEPLRGRAAAPRRAPRLRAPRRARRRRRAAGRPRPRIRRRARASSSRTTTARRLAPVADRPQPHQAVGSRKRRGDAADHGLVGGRLDPVLVDRLEQRRVMRPRTGSPARRVLAVEVLVGSPARQHEHVARPPVEADRRRSSSRRGPRTRGTPSCRCGGEPSVWTPGRSIWIEQREALHHRAARCAGSCTPARRRRTGRRRPARGCSARARCRPTCRPMSGE